MSPQGKEAQEAASQEVAWLALHKEHSWKRIGLAIVLLLSHQHLSDSTRAHPIACTAVRLVNSVLLFLQAKAERGLPSTDYTSEAARLERSLASQWREVASVRLPCTALQYTLKHRLVFGRAGVLLTVAVGIQPGQPGTVRCGLTGIDAAPGLDAHVPVGA